VKVIEQEPRSGFLFAFCNGRRNRLKLLWYHDGGYFIAAKRLEHGTFAFPRDGAGAARMSTAQLLALLKGVEFKRPNRECWR
jgi:transposase